MALNKATTTVTATNCSARVAFGAAYSVTADGWLILGVSIAALNGAAATITADVDITRSAATVSLTDVRYSASKRSATSTKEQFTVGPFRVVNGDSVQLNLTSTNASDTAVTGTVYVDDWLFGSVSVAEWLGTAVPSPNTAGYPLVDAAKWVGGTIPAVNQTGVPLVDLKYILGTLSPATAGYVAASLLTDPAFRIRAGTAQAGASATITLDSGASAVDDYYNETTLVILTGGTGAGQVRDVSDYVGSTKVATVSPAWTTNPDNTTTFVLIPGGGGSSGTVDANVVSWKGTTAAAVDTNGYPKVTVKSGTGTGEISLTSGTVTVTDASITAAKFGSGAIDATAFAQAAADKVWSTTARVLTAGTNIALAKGTGVTGFNDITAAAVWAAATRTLTSLSGLTVDTVTDVTNGVTLSSATLTALFTDTDTTALVNAIIARVETDLDGSDLSVTAIATATRNAIQAVVLNANVKSFDAVLGSKFETNAKTFFQNAGANTTKTVDDVGTAVTGSGFTGSRQVTLTFEDSAHVAVGNVVFSVEGVAATATDGTGIITVGLNDGTYTVVTSPTSSVVWEPEEIDVDATHTTFTITGASRAITPPDSPDKTTGWLLALDANADPIAGVVFTNRMIDGGGVAGFSYPDDDVTATSAVDGLVEFTDLVPGAKYEISSADGEEYTYTAGAAPSFSIVEVMRSADE